MERRSLHDFLGPEEVARIFELRSELTRFKRTLGAMAELVRKLVRGHFPCLSAEMTPYFTTSRTMSTACSPWSTASCLSCPRSSGQQPSGSAKDRCGHSPARGLGGDLAVPTAIAGIYGMNFKHMPELDTPYGCFVVLG